MEEQRPVIIELNLQKIAKQSLWLTFLPLIALLIIRGLLQGELSLSFSVWYFVYALVGYILLIVIHEFFHLLGFRIFCNVPWKNMAYGVNLKMGIAYATADQLMDNKGIRKALLLPFWMTGVLPAIMALYFNDGVLLLLSAMLIGGAAGDIAMYKELKKFPDDAMVKDDPELPKLYVYPVK
ncbi:hypothetical protein CSV71_04230 [Sporosarcina sp. P21c]|uniref:DUF3267 domain-containing protein n=1 Tax=unclassified Sporosarcina TaxID=2647733 RepID=UPI000C16BB79|nr:MULTISPECIES: DUF3267 domain-containing protein [unclassified Sporosarcina]PIC66415.1 hypothetical protein CSV78_12805 [Sporosarcina sp. P16a]PIC90334.1 hypothetical protein CSV71_04230 [Sporosarcina sp. P21c]PIC93862.1 hypothetical protein CSV70_01870 [Sporosarcina sp. P25]